MKLTAISQSLDLHNISHFFCMWILLFKLFPFFFNFQQASYFLSFLNSLSCHIANLAVLGHKYTKYSDLYFLATQILLSFDFTLPQVTISALAEVILPMSMSPKMYHTNCFIFPSWEDEDLLMVMSSYKDI